MFKVVCCQSSQTVQFACWELKKYLRMMMPEEGDIAICQGNEAGIRVGTFGALQLPEDESREDDILKIEVRDGRGYISGSNERSVLLAVYRFLFENGCRWPRPGIDGELIPQRMPEDTVYYHRASKRYRGLCIEGAVSFRNMLDNIEWAPKLGYNTYFLEFTVPYTFFNQWYVHRHNPLRSSEAVSVENVRQWTAVLEAEIQKRGMSYHAVGHAWTCEALGISGLGWDRDDRPPTSEAQALMAEIDGKRGLFKGVALNTNLCYSNPLARRRLVEYCADYTEKNGQIDYLHVWLADGYNNHCECADCSPYRPADLYVKLLNEIDCEFTLRGIQTKVVFLIYVDLLWPPVQERIANPDRFALLFAPITRTYNQSYAEDACLESVSEYERNRLLFPAGLGGNLAYLAKWREQFKGDVLSYEYYFWLDHYYDPGYYRMARTIYADVRHMAKHGIDGLISDQTQRSFLPSGFPMYLMGAILFDDSLEFDDLAEDFFSSYGEDGALCRAYLEHLSELFHPEYLRTGFFPVGEAEEAESPQLRAGVLKDLKRVARHIEDFRPTILKNTQSGTRCLAQSWRLLLLHGEICRRLAAAWVARIEGDMAEAIRLWKETAAFAYRNEEALQDVFDVFLFTEAYERVVFNENAR